MNKIIIRLLKLYKSCVSPYMPCTCKFYPSCSEYAMQAFRCKGFFRALFLSIKRFLRCNPFSKGGIDLIEMK